MQFDRIAPPAPDTPLTELQVEGATLDLHQLLQFIGLTYGAEEATVTMGWAATREVPVRREGKPAVLSGLALTLSDVSRFEVSFQPAPESAPDAALMAGSLDYFEFRHDPEPTLVFFFESGTIRLSGGVLRGEVLVEEPRQFNVIQ